MQNGETSVHGPLDDFTFGDAFANVGELEGVEYFSGSEEGMCSMEVSAEERATDEGALDSNLDSNHCHEQQDPIGRSRLYNTHGDRSPNTLTLTPIYHHEGCALDIHISSPKHTQAAVLSVVPVSCFELLQL